MVEFILPQQYRKVKRKLLELMTRSESRDQLAIPNTPGGLVTKRHRNKAFGDETDTKLKATIVTTVAAKTIIKSKATRSTKLICDNGSRGAYCRIVIFVTRGEYDGYIYSTV